MLILWFCDIRDYLEIFFAETSNKDDDLSWFGFIYSSKKYTEWKQSILSIFMTYHFLISLHSEMTFERKLEWLFLMGYKRI